MEETQQTTKSEQIALRHHVIGRLKNRKQLSPLTPEHVWHPSLDANIAALSEADLALGHPDGLLSARAWKAALHLWNDSLSAAHDLVEHLETPRAQLCMESCTDVRAISIMRNIGFIVRAIIRHFTACKLERSYSCNNNGFPMAR